MHAPRHRVTRTPSACRARGIAGSRIHPPPGEVDRADRAYALPGFRNEPRDVGGRSAAPNDAGPGCEDRRGAERCRHDVFHAIAEWHRADRSRDLRWPYVLSSEPGRRRVLPDRYLATRPGATPISNVSPHRPRLRVRPGALRG